MADVTIENITSNLADTTRDAFYVAVGVGVIAFQKLQVQRVELTKAVTKQLDEAKGSATEYRGNVTDLVDDRVKLIEERLSGLEERLESLLNQLEGKLPEQAKDLVQQARDLVGRAA
jgi:uncharacterized protein YjbJ (UPF0337 family)